jgi:hypothetical protein
MRRFLAIVPLLLTLLLAWPLEMRGRARVARRSQAAVEARAEGLAGEVTGRVDRILAAQKCMALNLPPMSDPSEAAWQELLRRSGAQGLPGLRFIQVVFRVAAKDRLTYEAALRLRVPGARIWDIQGGREGALQARDFYYPIDRCDPPRPDLLGLDQAGRLESWSDIYLPAEREGGPKLGGPIHTVLYPERVAVLLAMPAGLPRNAGPASTAFVTTVIDLSQLTEGLGPGLGWTLHDGPVDHPSAFLAKGGEPVGAYATQRIVPLFQRVWTLRVRGGEDPAARAEQRRWRLGLGVLLLIGTLTTGLLWGRADRG